MAKFKMPDREPIDGAIGIENLDDGGFLLKHDPKYRNPEDDNACRLLVSRYNAVRLLGLLSVILEIPLDKKFAELIEL